MKPGIIYGGTFLFGFVIVTGLLIYLNSSYENIFQFNFAPKSATQFSNSTKTDSLNIIENKKPLSEPDSPMVMDSVLLSSLELVETNDSTKKEKDNSENVKIKIENIIPVKEDKVNETLDPKTNITTNQDPDVNPKSQNVVENNEYKEWVKKITSIYSSMEPKKAAKIIQTYSDNVARDILYNMNKKTAAKVVSEFSPETANRIFRFE